MGILEVVEWPLHGGLPGIVGASGCHVEGVPGASYESALSG